MKLSKKVLAGVLIGTTALATGYYVQQNQNNTNAQETTGCNGIACNETDTNTNHAAPMGNNPWTAPTGNNSWITHGDGCPTCGMG